MSGLGIIINPYSRSNRNKPDRAKQFGFIVGDKGTCHETRDLNDVERLAREFKARGVEMLGISGGDGTYHATLSTFLDVYGDEPLPKIAFLRGGTMNNIATELGIMGKSEKILSNLILKYHHGENFEERELSMMKVNGKYGFIFGFGLVSNFMKVYHSREGYPSPARAAWVLFRCGLSSLFNGKFASKISPRIECDIFIDGEKASFVNYTIVLAGTIENLGLGFRTMKYARKDPERFHFLGFSLTPRGLLKRLPFAFFGRNLASDAVIDSQPKNVLVKFTEPITYTIDGDMFEDNQISISVGPRIKCVIP